MQAIYSLHALLSPTHLTVRSSLWSRQVIIFSRAHKFEFLGWISMKLSVEYEGGIHSPKWLAHFSGIGMWCTLINHIVHLFLTVFSKHNRFTMSGTNIYNFYIQQDNTENPKVIQHSWCIFWVWYLVSESQSSQSVITVHTTWLADLIGWNWSISTLASTQVLLWQTCVLEISANLCQTTYQISLWEFSRKFICHPIGPEHLPKTYHAWMWNGSVCDQLTCTKVFTRSKASH
jgi:hypothetical protein